MANTPKIIRKDAKKLAVLSKNNQKNGGKPFLFKPKANLNPFDEKSVKPLGYQTRVVIKRSDMPKRVKEFHLGNNKAQMEGHLEMIRGGKAARSS
jgi:hypothetical protein